MVGRSGGAMAELANPQLASASIHMGTGSYPGLLLPRSSMLVV